jgi:uncharacterized protein YjiS (DUF1127 family)
MFTAFSLLSDAIFGKLRSSEQSRAIRDLKAMTDKDLADIGISRYDIERVVMEGKR